MSEWSYSSNQFEDDADTPSPTPDRRPVSLPLPNVERTVPAPQPAAERLPERPAVMLFDRSLLETQVSAPAPRAEHSVHTPLAAEVMRQKQEEDEDDDDAEASGEAGTAPAAEPEEIVVQQPAEAPAVFTPTAETHAASPVEDDRSYVTPVVPVVPATPLSTVHPASSSQPPQPVATMPRPQFEEVMAQAELPDDYIDAVSGPQLGEYAPGTTTEQSEASTEDDPDEWSASPSQPVSRVNGQAATQTAGSFGQPGYQPQVAPVFNPNVTSNAPQSPQPPVANTGGGGSPPAPPPNVGGGFGGNYAPTPPSGGGPGNPNHAYNYASNFNVQPMMTGYTDDDLQHARRTGVVQGAVAGGVVGWFAGRHSARRGARRREEQLTQQIEDQQAINVQQEQTLKRLDNQNLEVRDAITNRLVPAERPAPAPAAPERPSSVYAPSSAERPVAESAAASPRPFEIPGQRPAEAVPAPTLQAAETVPATQAGSAPEAGDPFKHQAEEQPARTMRSEWLEIGLDKDGRPLEQEYGRAFQEEIIQEQAGSKQYMTAPQQHGSSGQAPPAQSPQPQDMYSGGAGFGISAGGLSGGTSSPAPGPGRTSSSYDPRLGSGQVPYDHMLRNGQMPPDIQHRLPQPKKQIVSNIANPWFWLMFALIVTAFFAAALI